MTWTKANPVRTLLVGWQVSSRVEPASLARRGQSCQDHHRGHVNRSPGLGKLQFISISWKENNYIFLSFTACEQQTLSFSALWALKRNVLPRLMTYQTAEFTQNPVLGNGAQLSKVLNLFVKTEDAFKGGQTHFLPTVPAVADICSDGHNWMRTDGWTDNRRNYRKASWWGIYRSNQPF